MTQQFTKYQHYLDRAVRSPHTRRAYLSDLRSFAVWFEQTNAKGIDPQTVTPVDMREWRQRLSAVQELKAATVNRKISAVAHWLSWHRGLGHVQENVAHGIGSIKHKKRVPQGLSKPQQHALMRLLDENIQVAQGKGSQAALQRAIRTKALVYLLLHAGLRADEALHITFNNLVIQPRSGRVTVIGKGNKERSVPLNATLRAALSAWIAIRPEAATNIVFISQKKVPMDTSSLRRLFKKIRQDAKIGDSLTPHVLRHTFAHNLIAQGVSIEKVADLLGHADVNTTMIYVQPNAHVLSAAVDTLG